MLTDKFTILLPVFLGSVIAPWCVRAKRFESQNDRLQRGMACLAAACVVALLIWFVQAPAGRFAFVYFYLPFAVVFTSAVVRPSYVAIAVSTLVGIAAGYALLGTAIVPAQYRTGIFLLIGFCTGWLVLARWALVKSHSRMLTALCLCVGMYQVIDRGVAHALRGRFELIRPLLWVQVSELPERSRQVQYTPQRTYQGLVVYETRASLYETPLPNTKYFNPYLSLRVPGDLVQGFRNTYAQDPTHYGYSVRMVGDPGATDVEEIMPDILRPPPEDASK